MDTCVIQIRCQLFVIHDTPVQQIQGELAALIDQSFTADEELKQFHEANKFKFYSFDLPYPLEPDKIYKMNKIYTVTIRTIDPRLAKHFSEVCVNQYTDKIKALTAEIRTIPKKTIETIYTLTPAILKSDEGYWRTHMKLAEFEERLKVNLIKKWNAFEGGKIPEEFQLYTLLEFLNEGPIKMQYKGISLLGDKIRLHIADNKMAQNLAYLAIGTGVLEMNSRGAGFVNYRWL